MTRREARPDRVQTGVRLERRLVKVLKALAALQDLSLGEFLEDLVRDAFAGRQPFQTLPWPRRPS
jgi:predicted DNA-binding ribbon-helix-helix protein